MESSTNSRLDVLISSYLHMPATRAAVVVPQFLHRQNICDAWEIPAGIHMLDIGCGQGESSLVLADVVGPHGYVTAVDPAPADYGSPYTLGESQRHILCSPLAPRINFISSDPVSYLRSSSRLTKHADGNCTSDLDESAVPLFDGVSFCHSIWYFSSESKIRETFSAIAAARVPRIYLAEWTGEKNTDSQLAHYLAALAQALLHSSGASKTSPQVFEQNVRSAVLHGKLLQIAESEGWRVARKGILSPPEGMMDGHWEAQFVASKEFKRMMTEDQLSPDVMEELELLIEKTRQATAAVEGSESKRVACMDVFWAVLERDAQ